MKKCANCGHANKAGNPNAVYCRYWQEQRNGKNMSTENFIKCFIFMEHNRPLSMAIGWGYPNKPYIGGTFWGVKGTVLEGLMWNDQICVPIDDCCHFHKTKEAM